MSDLRARVLGPIAGFLRSWLALPTKSGSAALRPVLLFEVAASLGGCASILEDRTQQIVIRTEPPGASCRLLRSGVMIGQLGTTPSELLVRKSTYDIVIVCNKDGYRETSYVNRADVAAATVVSAILGGATGWAVDSATGTANKYESPVTITLAPISVPNQSPVQQTPGGQ